MDIRIVGPDECDYFENVYSDLFGGRFDIAGRVPGKNYYYCDGITWHRYPQTDNEPGVAEVDDFRVRILRCAKLVDRANAKLGRSGDDALFWGLTEFNAKGGTQVHTFGNGQMFAAVLGLSELHGARMALSWSIYESGGNRGKTDFGLFDGRHYAPRPSAEHMRLYIKHMQGTPIELSHGNADVIVIGCRQKDGFSFMLMNFSQNTKHAFGFVSDRSRVGGDTSSLRFHIPGLKREIVGSVDAMSTALVEVDGGAANIITYSAADFQQGRPPTAPVRMDAKQGAR